MQFRNELVMSTGGMWTFTALAGGKFRLTNAALGPGWSLAAPPDIATWNFVLMAATADVPAQHWVVSANP